MIERITYRIEDLTQSHVRFSLRINGGRAGSLCLRTEEFDPFIGRLKAISEEDWIKSQELLYEGR